jgi:3-hydroxy-3-methylglutaryl CoA synthase
VRSNFGNVSTAVLTQRDGTTWISAADTSGRGLGTAGEASAGAGASTNISTAPEMRALPTSPAASKQFWSKISSALEEGNGDGDVTAADLVDCT